MHLEVCCGRKILVPISYQGEVWTGATWSEVKLCMIPIPSESLEIHEEICERRMNDHVRVARIRKPL